MTDYANDVLVDTQWVQDHLDDPTIRIVEVDDIAQMIEAQNELKRRRGAPEISEEEIEARVREDREQLRRWRES